MEHFGYEEFYQEMKQSEKRLGDKLKQAAKSFRGIVQSAGFGNVKKLEKEIDDLKDSVIEVANFAEEAKSILEGFDYKSYFESGAFTEQMVECCKNAGIDIKGEAGVFEMFPFKVRVDAENQDLYVNRKKVQCMRPAAFADDMKKNVDKYTKASFNLSLFTSELAAAYDLAAKIKNSESHAPRYEFDIILKDLYEYLAPTSRARKEYDIQQYAYELSKLYAARDEVVTKNGRRLAFGPCRYANKLIRILDENGYEQYLGTIRFFK